MKKLSGYCGKIAKVDVIDVSASSVTFEDGSTHRMINDPFLRVGNIVAIDNYGGLWLKSGGQVGNV